MHLLSIFTSVPQLFATCAFRSRAEQPRRVKIDADIDEVIKTIQGLGGESDEKASVSDGYGEKPSSEAGGD
jgi:hypothetical protein